MRTKQVSVWLTDAALVARVRARAKTEQRTLAAVVEEALRGWLVAPLAVGELAEMTPAPPPVIQKGPPVMTAQTGTPVAAPRTKAELLAQAICRGCGHEQRTHEPHCILMGCPCRKFF